MEVILPIRAQQEIKSYTKFALPLCVIMTNKSFHPWILKKFMDIKSTKSISKSGNHLTYSIDENFDNNLASLQYDEVLELESSSWKAIENPIDFVMDKLQNNFYVHAQLNEFYISKKRPFQKTHFIHPSLIYGFCKKEDAFNAVGFVNDKRFSTFNIGVDEFSASVMERNTKDSALILNSHHELNVYSYRVRTGISECKFEFDEFLRIFSRYVSSPEDDDWVYGVGGYQIALDGLRQSADNNGSIKYNTIHFLHEHKKIFYLALKDKIGKLSASKSITQCLRYYERLIEMFDSLRWLCIELAMSDGTSPYVSKPESVNILYEKFSSIRDYELQLVESLHRELI